MKRIIITAVNKGYIDMARALEQSVIENGCAEFRRYLINDTPIRVSHSRARLIKETLLQGYDIVAWFDADTLIVRNIESFWEGVEPNSIKVLYRPEQAKTKRRFNAGVIAFGLETLKFVKKWEKRLVDSTWIYKDQKTFYQLYKKYKHEIKFIKMGKEFNDYQFNDDSYIWHNKLKDKSSATKFLERQLHYFDESQKSNKEV